jgi:hypothetical protein
MMCGIMCISIAIKRQVSSGDKRRINTQIFQISSEAAEFVTVRDVAINFDITALLHEKYTVHNG